MVRRSIPPSAYARRIAIDCPPGRGTFADGALPSNRELTETYFGGNTLENHLALRIALLADKIYFRRKEDAR